MRAGFRLTFSHDPLDDELSMRPSNRRHGSLRDRAPRKLFFLTMNSDMKRMEVWFVTGSQHLYGLETLKKVAGHSQEIARALNVAPAIPVKVVFKPVLVTPDAVTELCQAANNAAQCIGLVIWCHTFSPSKMWINGLKQLRKPVAHLHTQYNRDIPWATIDMDFMNLNQAAHGDREHGF